VQVPLIALEVVLGFVVPVGWGISELLSLRRDRRRGEEFSGEAADAQAATKAAGSARAE
jgi:hypothetical protein